MKNVAELNFFQIEQKMLQEEQKIFEDENNFKLNGKS